MDDRDRDKLRELVSELYDEKGIEIEPLFPRVLVRVLPREQRTRNGLILPDGAQNKPIHEGIVLRVYKPFWQHRHKLDNWYVRRAEKVIVDRENQIDAIWQESSVKPGDHVVFPHMAMGIMPVWPLDEGTGAYRMIPEGELVGVLRYKDLKTKDWLLEKMSLSKDNELGNLIAKSILKDADVIRKDISSKTISGA